MKLTNYPLYVNRQRVALASLKQSKGFQDLDQRIQNLINSLSEGPKNFEDVKDLIQDQNKKMMNHVSSEFQEHRKHLDEEDFSKRLLESLWFPEILSREETIPEAHSRTFQWIFDRSGQAVRPWDNFIAWLENGKGIYWINGKAGSGKSTLMNFLCQDERTMEALTIWSETKDIILPKFFFWSAGNAMQKSLEGLLRSLLWQILNEYPEMTFLPSDDGPQSEHSRRTPRNHNLIGAWTKARLSKTLQGVVNQLQRSCRLCLFIDGLDEFDEDEDDLITFVQNLVLTTSVKVCSSSRPHKAFEDAFSSSAKLRLQDLTYGDIQQYVDDKFEAVPQLRSMTAENEFEMTRLKKDIVDKAEGIFLWVSLAVKDQIRGLKNEDSPAQLQARLTSLPTEIEGIYHRMLLQIDKLYRQEASLFLQMALNRPGLAILEHALASHKGLEKILLSADNIPEQEILSICQSTRKRIIATCVGLLEVHEESATRGWRRPDFLQPDADPGDDSPAFDAENGTELNHEHESTHLHAVTGSDDSIPGSGTKSADEENFRSEWAATVNFVHRTVVDFLTDTGPGVEFLEANTPPEFDPQNFYVKALLGKLRLHGCVYHTQDSNYGQDLNNIDDIAREVAEAEDRSGAAQTTLCELLDSTMSVLDRLYLDKCPDSHWSARWGRLAKIMQAFLDGSYSSTTSSSRSSSRDSYYTAMSQTTNTRDLDTTPTESMNFIDFAASHGLSHYVRQILDCRQEPISPETLDYMLFCSTVYPPANMSSWVMLMKVVPDLLRRGANPNAKVFSKTIWEVFLELFVFYRTFDSLEHHHRIMETISSFIGSGADVGTVWTFHTAVRHIAEIDTPSSAVYIAFDLQLSALSAIQLFLKNKLEFPRVQEMCIANGAILYVRCQVLELTFIDEKGNDGGFLKQYELSEQESRDFVGIYEDYLSSWRLCGADPIRKALRRQIQEFAGRLDDDRVTSII